MRTENYYEKFGSQFSEVVKFFDDTIARMEKDLEEFKKTRQNHLDNFAKDNSNYVIGQKLSENVRIDDIVWSDSWSQISLIVFNDHYGIDTILESEVKEYLKGLGQ